VGLIKILFNKTPAHFQWLWKEVTIFQEQQLVQRVHSVYQRVDEYQFSGDVAAILFDKKHPCFLLYHSNK
jgi:hypothetical protein